MAPRLHRDHYMVLWVCALPIELAAARAMLDEEHDIPLPDARLSEGSNIKHIYGRVGRHNVVITRLLKEKEGAYSAADTLVKDMMRVFTSLRFGLMVGIAGGVPSKKADIRLGDVVVSSPYGLRGGVVQYTYDNSNNRIRTESSINWPLELYDAIANLRAEHRRVRRKLYQHLSKFESLLDFTQETAGPDTLYAATYHHQGGAICLQCDKSYLVDREPRSQELGVMVHYGTIASGDRIMKSAIERDKFSAQLGDVLCFETEIAGMSNSVPSLVIRGISDYADSHKNDRWQAYAAATAAAYAKVVLSTIAKRDVAKMPMNYKVIRGPWENPVSRQEYQSIKELVNEIAADHHISFNSITWEWVLPAIPQPDMKNDVVLMCTSSRAHTAADFAHVHALTYWDYLKQSRWADFIMEILETLALVELDTAHGGFSMYAIRNPRVWITCSFVNLSINFGDKQTGLEILDLIEALDWLCKSMRRPTNETGHEVSSASYSLKTNGITKKKNTIFDRILGFKSLAHTELLYVKMKRSPLPKIKHGCWLSLFDSCIITDSPLTPYKGSGKGLETSFDLMIMLAASEFCLKIKDSLVFLGYRTLLYPVKIEGNCAQFHLITTDHGQINPYTLDLKNILPVDNSSQFKTMRCFVGWCKDAHINLGTERLATQIRYTGGEYHPTSLELDGYSLLGQFGASAPLSAIVGVQQNFKYSRHRVRFTPTENYLGLLQDTSQQSVVLYDSKQHRCWLVPKLSLLLHMAQRYTSPSAIPYAKPHMDAQELISFLEPVGQTKVLAGNSDPIQLQNLLFALSIRMLSTTEALRESGHGKLYGFEFMDVVRNPDQGSCMKELKIISKRKAWLELVNGVGTVIVCSDLGEVISAEGSNARKCRKCNRVPENEDYFTATIPCLSRLAEQKGVELIVGSDGVKLSDKVIWKLETNPFIQCTHEESSNETCWERPGLIQKVVRRGAFNWTIPFRLRKPQPARPGPVQPPLVKGVVVFR